MTDVLIDAEGFGNIGFAVDTLEEQPAHAGTSSWSVASRAVAQISRSSVEPRRDQWLTIDRDFKPAAAGGPDPRGRGTCTLQPASRSRARPALAVTITVEAGSANNPKSGCARSDDPARSWHRSPSKMRPAPAQRQCRRRTYRAPNELVCASRFSEHLCRLASASRSSAGGRPQIRAENDLGELRRPERR